MKISVFIKTNSKKEKIEKIGKNQYKIFVKEQPIEGKANNAIIRILADFFDIAKSRINIVSGKKSKNKIIEIV